MPFEGRDARDATVTAILGPTNTGKTHYAIERMLARRSGVIGFPLRLLAREVYDKIVALKGPRAVALITGEEKIAPADARYVICTVESMPLDWGAEFLAVDEIQLCADGERGHVFTDRLLRARGTEETLFLGSETMRPRIAALIPQARFATRPRLSTLSYAGPRKLSRLPARSAIVAFSVEQVYAIGELLRRQKGGAAIVMGALSPRTRNAQVALYQNGDVEHLVATDAIGMGLNLDLKHVAFAGLRKFDGRRHRALAAHELAQIAGRAGRHMSDGTFGATGDAGEVDPDDVDRIVRHSFDPVTKLQWRNAALDYGTVPALIRSLEAPPPRADLIRGPEADDLSTLRALFADLEIREVAKGGAAVRLLWDVCQVPDFRKTHPTDHAQLLGRIYRFLLDEPGVIPPDWIEGHVRRLDRVDGDIDALSKRLAYVRTWTYVANRGRWLDDPAEWRGRTRDVEDRLSDALHDRLTKRFVDRRTSVLMKRLKQRERLVAEVSDAGEVTVEGHHVGRLEGFVFRADPEATGDEKKTLQTASLQALQAQLASRADKFYNAPDTEMEATDQGGLMWGEHAVGRLEPGDDQLAPRIRPFVDDSADPAVAEKVQRRLGHWVDRRIKALFEPLLSLRDDPALTGLARGVAFQLVEGLGVLTRRSVADEVKQLDQESRAMLRKHGVRFGQHHVFMPALLKPAPTRLRLLLWGLHSKLDELPSAPPPGLVTIPAEKGAPEGFYLRAGYRLAGSRALRIDMLERLADMIRPLDQRAGFESSADMLSITGLTLDQFADLMQGIGFQAERGERAARRKGSASVDAAPSDGPGAAEGISANEAPTTGAAADSVGAPAAEGASAEPSGAAQAAPSSDVEQRAPEAESVAAAAPAASSDAEAADSTASVATAPEPSEAASATVDRPAAAAPDAPASSLTEAPAVVAPSGDETDADVAGDSATSHDPVSEAQVSDSGGDPGSSEGASDDPAATQGEGEPVEVFFTFRLAPRGPRRARPQQGRRRGDGAQPAGEGGRGAAQPADAQGPRKSAGGGPRRKPDAEGRKESGGKSFGKPGGKPRRPEKGPRSDKPRTFAAAPERSGREADPDNPFAVLKQLKDRL